MEVKNDMQLQFQQLENLQVSSIDINSFLTLTALLDTGNKQQNFDRRMFKVANDKLVEFSKTPNAWDICFKVLEAAVQGSVLSEQQIFQAASILKNKMMFDFVALKQQHGANQSQVTIQLRKSLLQILSQMTWNQTIPSFIINTLAIALAYLTIHTHQEWSTIIEDVSACLSGSIDQALCLLQVIKYMANDCDNDSIVIEDSIRKAYYGYLDGVSREKVFKSILDLWSSRINQEVASPKLTKLKCAIIDAFYCWIKLRLPEDLFANLVTDCPNLLVQVFEELASESVENVEVAAKCIVELLSLSRSIEMFSAIKTYVWNNAHKLLTSASVAIQKNDVDRADHFSYIFAELAKSYMSQIIENGSTEILEILVQLLEGVLELSCKSQLPFWKEFFNKLNKHQDKDLKLTSFSTILIRLLGCLSTKATIPDYLLPELNQIPMRDEMFDEFIYLRRDIGSLIRNLCKCCGSQPVITYIQQRIDISYQKLDQAHGDQYIQVLCEIESGLFVITELSKTISSDELSSIFNIVDLILKLPQDYVALRLQSTEFIIAIAHLLSKKEANQKLIPQLLQYVLKGLTESLTLPVSSYTFHIMCKENSQFIAPYALELVSQILVPQFVEKWDTDDKYADIMRGFGLLIPDACQQNSEQCGFLLKAIIQAMLLPVNIKVQEFLTIKKTGEGIPTSKTLTEISEKIMLFGDFMKYCSGLSDKTTSSKVNPLLPIFNELWPFLELVLTEFIYNDDIIEYTCRLIKHSQRALGNQFLPFLYPFLKKAMIGYQQNPLGTFVYAVEFCFTEFGHQPQHQDIFIEALDFIIKSSANFLVSIEVCEQNPDLINDIFGMAMRYVRYNKSYFFSSTQLEQFVQFMMRCIGLNQNRAAKAHSEFMIQLLQGLYDDLREVGFVPIEQSGMIQRQQLMWQYLRGQGVNIMNQYIQALLAVPSKEVSEFFVNVLVEVSIVFSQESRDWLSLAMVQVPITVFTEENKLVLLEMFNDEFGVRKGSLMQEFDLLAKRARSSAVRQK